MTETAERDVKGFEYTYSAKKQQEIDRIREKYLPKEEDKVETLRKLDKSTEKPGTIAALALGITGTLMLGIGMCCTMVWKAPIWVFVLGIVVGIIGIVIASTAYPMYKKVTGKQREKVAEKILELTSELSL